MSKSKYTARIDNIYFLSRIGSSLRWATQDISHQELPANIKHLLARLDRLEARAKAKREEPANDPSVSTEQLWSERGGQPQGSCE
jgi:hypothetical protein